MIIKSTARKKPSFRQLIEYMEKEDGERLLYHNLYATEQTPTEQLINQFETNAQRLPKRKNGNYLYHEIISFEKTDDIKEKQLNDIAYELATLYLEERSKNQLAFSVMHKDTDHLHLHFCISANELGEKKRVRLSKAQFAQIQKNLENYVLTNYPELNQSKIYTKEKEPQKLKTTDREQSLKKRTKQASRKEQLKTQLHGIFEQANTQQELIEILQKNGFSLYTRGKAVGVIKDQKKYRLKTLGLLPHYQATNERLAALETEKEKKPEATPETQEKEEKQPEKAQSEPETTKENQQPEEERQYTKPTPEPEPEKTEPKQTTAAPEPEAKAPNNEPRQQRQHRERPSAPHRQDQAPAQEQTQPAAPEPEPEPEPENQTAKPKAIAKAAHAPNAAKLPSQTKPELHSSNKTHD